MADDCIFCKIISGQIPALKIYEDANFIGILDINPRRRGHAVVIPKRHAKTLLDLSEKLTGEYLEVVQAVARHIVGALGAKGFNFGSNNGEAAGQMVPHVHIHILPRFSGEKITAGFEAIFQPDEALKKELEPTHKKIGRLAPLIRPEFSEQKEEKPTEEENDKKSGEPAWDFNDRANQPTNF